MILLSIGKWEIGFLGKRVSLYRSQGFTKERVIPFAIKR